MVAEIRTRNGLLHRQRRDMEVGCTTALAAVASNPSARKGLHGDRVASRWCTPIEWWLRLEASRLGHGQLGRSTTETQMDNLYASACKDACLETRPMVCLGTESQGGPGCRHI